MAKSKLAREIELAVNRIAHDRAVDVTSGSRDRKRYRLAYLEQKIQLLAKVTLWSAAGESEEGILQRLGARQLAKQQALTKALNELRKMLLDME